VLAIFGKGCTSIGSHGIKEIETHLLGLLPVFGKNPRSHVLHTRPFLLRG